MLKLHDIMELPASVKSLRYICQRPEHCMETPCDLTYRERLFTECRASSFEDSYPKGTLKTSQECYFNFLEFHKHLLEFCLNSLEFQRKFTIWDGNLA